VTHGVLQGKKKFRMANQFWLWQFVWVLNGPAFVTIVTTMFQCFSCVLIENNVTPEQVSQGMPKFNFRLVEDTELVRLNSLHFR
jgi:hypothetical protein